MSTRNFERERRYTVIKTADAERFLSVEERSALATIEEKINQRRWKENRGKLTSVVVEQDWPEYETVWKMIEDRVKG